MISKPFSEVVNIVELLPNPAFNAQSILLFVFENKCLPFSRSKRSLKGFLLYIKGDWKDSAPIGSPSRVLGPSPLVPPDSEFSHGSPQMQFSFWFSICFVPFNSDLRFVL